MDLFSEIDSVFERIWEPVLKPQRTPTCNDLLGFGYIYTENQRIYKRIDFKIRTFDYLQLQATCYLRLTSPPDPDASGIL